MSPCTKHPDFRCCYNQFEDPNIHGCVECLPGYIGWNCSEMCNRGFYGTLCQLTCPCSAMGCNHITGCIADSPEVFRVHTSTQQSSFVTLQTTNTEGLVTAPSTLDSDDVDWVTISSILIGPLVMLVIAVIGFCLYFQFRKNKRFHSLEEQATARHVVNSDVRNIGLSNFTTRHVHQDDNSYSEIRYSQLDQACAAPVPLTSNNNGECSKMVSMQFNKENVYGKCTSEGNYSQLEFKKGTTEHVYEYITQKTVRCAEQRNMMDGRGKHLTFSFQQHKHSSFMSLPRRFYSTVQNDIEMASPPLLRTISEPYLHQMKTVTIKTTEKYPSDDEFVQ